MRELDRRVMHANASDLIRSVRRRCCRAVIVRVDNEPEESPDTGAKPS